MRRCVVLGEQTAAANSFGNQYSSRGAERNPMLLALSKAAEVAFVLMIGLDPDKAVYWNSIDAPDSGYDCYVNGYRIDVKHTPRGRCLLWPANKVERFEKAPIDLFVLACGVGPVFEIAAWTTKDEFYERMTIAGAGHRSFDEGTWFLDRDRMFKIEKLCPMLNCQ